MCNEMFDITALSAAFGGFVWVLFFFVLALSFIVAVNEYGHYIVGRWCGIHAEVISIGIGNFSPILATILDLSPITIN